MQGTQKNLGYFINEEDAALAYDQAVLKRDGPNAKLNFPMAPGARLEALGARGTE